MPGAKVRRKFDRRAVFFGISAVVAILLLPLCPPELRFVGWILGAVYVVLALVSWADFHRGAATTDDRGRRPRQTAAAHRGL